LTHTDTQYWLDTLTGEALLCGLLGQMLYTHPERDWLQALAGSDIFAESPFANDHPDVIEGLAALRAWSEARQGVVDDATLSELKVDYAQLFIGTTTQMLVYPWESIYVEKEPFLFLESTLDVREWYARYGLEVINFKREPEDFIGFELSFLAHLSNLAVEAIERGDYDGLDDLLQAQRDFLSDHLLRWGFAWANKGVKVAETDFYRGIILLTRGALAGLAEVYEVDVPQTAGS